MTVLNFSCDDCKYTFRMDNQLIPGSEMDFRFQCNKNRVLCDNCLINRGFVSWPVHYLQVTGVPPKNYVYHTPNLNQQMPQGGQGQIPSGYIATSPIPVNLSPQRQIQIHETKPNPLTEIDPPKPPIDYMEITRKLVEGK